jgi:hypothetical protein
MSPTPLLWSIILISALPFKTTAIEAQQNEPAIKTLYFNNNRTIPTTTAKLSTAQNFNLTIKHISILIRTQCYKICISKTYKALLLNNKPTKKLSVLKPNRPPFQITQQQNQKAKPKLMIPPINKTINKHSIKSNQFNKKRLDKIIKKVPSIKKVTGLKNHKLK